MLGNLSWDELLELVGPVPTTRYEAGKMLYAPQENGQTLFLLREGRVQLYRLSSSGRKLVVAMLHPGAVFGESCLLGHGLHNTFAQALHDSVVGKMRREDVERLIQTKPEVTLCLIQALTRRIDVLERRLEAMAFKSISARLAALLLALSAHEDGKRVLGYTHQDLADVLGTYRETVTETLNALKKERVVSIGRKEIVVLDRARLQAAADS